MKPSSYAIIPTLDEIQVNVVALQLISALLPGEKTWLEMRLSIYLY